MRKLSAALGVYCVVAISPLFLAKANAADTVLSIMAGEPEWMAGLAKLASQLDHENHLRILPVLGSGGVQALTDLMQIPNVDAAIVASDTLAYALAQNLIPESKSVSYIAKLAPLDVVLIAKTELKNVTALAGKRIATGPAQSAGFATGEILFGALEIQFMRVPQQGELALAALLSGQADAALILGTSFQKSAMSDGRFHILDVPMPPTLNEVYQPAILNAEILPGLIAKGKTVESVSASLILAVQNWPRVSSHSSALKIFETELYKSQTVGISENLAASVLGWNRHITAQDLLNKSQTKSTTSLIITPTGGEP